MVCHVSFRRIFRRFAILPEKMQPSREQSSIRQKLGSILGLSASRAPALPQKSYDELGRPEHSTFFTADVLRELEQGVPMAQRVRAMKELHEIVATKRLEEHAVQAIWQAIKDLVDPSQPVEARHAALVFTRALIRGQFEDLGVLRAHFFRVVQGHAVKEDTQHRLELMRALTHDGRNIQYMEEAVGPFLVEWMPEAVTLGSAVEFLSLLVHLLHYNAACFEEESLVGLVQLSSTLANKSTQIEIIELCLDLLNAVVCYSSLPTDALLSFVTTLCLSLNIERVARKSLEVMLRLLGTHLGHSAIYTMCTILQERSRGQDALLLRGAVFYISMSLWGVRRVESLELSFGSVLPSVRQAVLSGHTIVVYEVALSLGRLVRCYSAQLHPLEWDLIYAALEAIQLHLSRLQQALVEPAAVPSSSLGQCLRELFASIEEAYEGGQSIGDAERFFSLLEGSTELLPVRSVLTLLSYRSSVICSAEPGWLEPGWLEQLLGFMEKFYRQETRSAIRVEALNFLGRVLAESPASHQSEVLERVALPVLQPVAEDPDGEVRCRAMQLLIHLLGETPKWAEPLLAIISSVLQNGLDKATQCKAEGEEGPKLPASKAAIFGLTQLFKAKLHSSSPVAAKVFHLLVAFLHQHYQQGCFLPTACAMRMNIFNCILSLRANEAGQVGYQESGSVRFSPFFTCCLVPGCETPAASSLSPTLLNYRAAFSAVLVCLEEEREWEVLAGLLHQLQGLLQDRTLTLAGMPDLSSLCQQLCVMAEEQGPHITQLYNLSSKADLAACTYPVLANLCSYPSHLDRKAQHVLVCCLEAGLVGNNAKTCISALEICSLELQATMTRLLPRVLYRLGQVAATPTLARPVLSFLAGLVPICALYSGFVEQQYLSVFGIALPYTSQEKYSSYVVVLAHQVIAMWFVRCRMQYRPTIARFIHKSLAMNLSRGGAGQQGKGGGEGRAALSELTEVCADMMARYVYSNLSTLPARSSNAEFLISGGPSKTWLVGHTLVTVTTSGQGGGKIGVCRRCAAFRTKTRMVDETAEDLGGLKLPGGVPDQVLCSCWCKGWAEILIRRPTGNISWMMRLQNRLQALSVGEPYSPSNADWSLLAPTYPCEAVGRGGKLGPPARDESETPQHKGEPPRPRPAASPGSASESGGSTPELLTPRASDVSTAPLTPRASDVSTAPLTPRASDIPTAPLTPRASDVPTAPLTPRASGVPTVPLTPRASDVSTPQQLPTTESSVGEVRVGSLEEGLLSSDSEGESQPPPRPEEAATPPSSRAPQTSPSKRQPSSKSWSERGAREVPPLSPRPSSYCALEHLPPLLSYDTGDDLGRSPSLHGSGGRLSDQEQVNLVNSVSEESELSETEWSATPLPSGDSSGSSSEDVGLSLGALDVPRGSSDTVVQPRAAPARQPVRRVASARPARVPRPRLTHQSASLPDTPEQPPLLDPYDTPPAMRRKSVPAPPSQSPASSPASGRKRLAFPQPTISGSPPEEVELYTDPSFIFLQLYHCCVLGEDTPTQLPSGENMERALKVLDHIPPYNTHKVGVVFVDRNQTQEQQVLSNTFGSSRYMEFLRGLGQLLPLKDTPPDAVYLGGLDRNGADGPFAYFYQDDITQVIFHVATLMPTRPTDPLCSNKKLHIGNNFVTIIYNGSQLPYAFGMIKGQFSFAEVLVEPLPGSMNRVSVRAKKGLEEVVRTESCLVSDAWLPTLARQKALQANLASLVHMSETMTEHYPSNWLGRLRQIKRIREKCLGEHPAGTKRTTFSDFTDYC